METHDDLAISALLDNFHSDENFAEELQIQEVIVSSFISLHKSGADSGKFSAEIGEESSSSSETLTSSSFNLTKSSVSIEPSRRSKEALTAPGESSQSLCDICDICADTKDRGDMFPFANCRHAFCTGCVAKHVTIAVKKERTRAKEGRVTVTCPGADCVTVLDIDECREHFPGDVIELWSGAICEAMIPPSQRFYCPYKGCSEMLVKESEEEEAECPSCNRLFCAKCKVPWHGGVDCEEYSRLEKDEREREDLMVHDLAKKMKWKRCPNCNFYVERIDGCMHMTCRCGYHFCHACGKVYSTTHACSG